MSDYAVCASGGKVNKSDPHTIGFNIFRIVEQETDDKPYYTLLRIGWTKDESTIPGFISRREVQRAALVREEAVEHMNSAQCSDAGASRPLVG